MNNADFTEDQIRQLRAAGIPLSEHAADRMRALCEADNLELFVIENTAGKRAFAIAGNMRFVRLIALDAGHIQSFENGTCYLASRAPFGIPVEFLSAVQRAIRDRTPGVVEVKGNHAVMGDKVYSPCPRYEDFGRLSRVEAA